MKAYVVGGAVRDELLGLPVADRDWVVVGATVEDMIRLGYRPVGKDFPVFLHPRTQEEYALARTERKSGRGYKGFTVHAAPEVTLEEDLRRRDLSINAMARDEHGALIDPFGGARDLKAGVLRHVSEAFAEDPLRILRVARFAARYGYRVADETSALMRRMVEAGEVEELVAERVWQELAHDHELWFSMCSHFVAKSHNGYYCPSRRCQSILMQKILVQPGTTLFRIAAIYFDDATQWSRIALINHVKDPFIFNTSTILNLPALLSKQGERYVKRF